MITFEKNKIVEIFAGAYLTKEREVKADSPKTEMADRQSGLSATKFLFFSKGTNEKGEYEISRALCHPRKCRTDKKSH